MDPPTVAHTDGLFFYALPFLYTRGSFSLVDSSTPFRFLALWPLYLALLIVLVSAALVCWASPGGPAWGSVSRGSSSRRCTIPGPRGWPVLGCLFDMGGQAHRKLATLARHHGALSLMAFSLGSTRVIITSSPGVARELLSSPGFADRPLKQSAQQLMFGRAIGFAPYGDYWRKLRRIAATHLFAPKRIAAHERYRQYETTAMLEAMALEAQLKEGIVQVRSFLQHASLNNIMVTVFGRRYNFGSDCEEFKELHSMVREGFDLLGAFNMADHLHALRSMDPQHILQRCAALVPRVTEFVMKIINDHKHRTLEDDGSSDFVDVLLALQDEEKLDNSDLVAILWEMIFRGTDTMAILTEWILAELILNPKIQSKLHAELDGVVGRGREVCDADLPKLPYLLAVVKEALRMHPPGPLLSWARLATHDLKLAGHHIPAGTTAMVNMWSITHDPSIWSEPDNFVPERFMVSEGGTDVDIRGNDLRLAPFGAGRRVCPGRALGLATVHMWVGRLLQRFEFTSVCGSPVDLSEVLKLSCEMVTPLSARLMDRSSR